MREVGVDRRTVGLGAVGDDDLDTLEPTMSLASEKGPQGRSAAMLDDAERVPGLGVDQHGHISMSSS